MTPWFDVSGRAASPVLALAALVSLLAPSAHAGWSAEPAEIHATTDLCPQVAACADAAHGAIVAWQQNTAGSAGPVYARHVLATGDVDPAWPAPATVCATLAARSVVGAVADGLGGAYVWWMSGATLSLTRIGPDGAIAAGWPAGGRELGTLISSSHRPSIVSDGAHGVYAAWSTNEYAISGVYQLVLFHLGPANTAAGGFPASGRRVIGAAEDEGDLVGSHAIAVATGGGLWVLRGTTVAGPLPSGFLDGEWRLTRLTAAGVPATGWDAHGIVLDAFPSTQLQNDWTSWADVPPHDGFMPRAALAAIADDGAGGVYVERYEPDPDFAPLRMEPHLYRLDSAGAPMAGWPAGGVPIGMGTLSGDYGPEYSLRALPDGAGNVYAGHVSGGTDQEPQVAFDHFSAAGVGIAGWVSTQLLGSECIASGDGGACVAGFNPRGPWWLYAGPAFAKVVQSAPGLGWSEYHDEHLTFFYDDVALASSGDGGAILFWSQESVRHGIYAVRVNAHGPVTGVPGLLSPTTARLALRFVAGEGVTAYAAFPAAGHARARLFDAAGRTVAASEFEAAAGSASWVLPGTGTLPAGLYLARVECGGSVSRAKVAVVR